jgi:serine/threonine-protein kinase HipA
MTTTGIVKLWGTPIGVFHLDTKTGYVSFEYSDEIITSGIEISPIMMPLSKRVYEFPQLIKTSFNGVPGLIADSLPDKFGNAVIDKWLDEQGRLPDSFNVVERLCYTGKRGMGALEYEPDQSEYEDIDEPVDMSKISNFASAILREKECIFLSSESDITYKQLLKLGTSAGGARAKAVIAYNPTTKQIRSGQVDLSKGFEYWLVKLDGVSKNGDHNLEDDPEYTLIEFAYYKMALEAGIIMSECQLLSEGHMNHFITRRFDRVDGTKVHMQSLSALTHTDYNIPGLYSYERAALIGRQLGLTSSDIEQFFRRMIFNVIAINQDDHVKNFSFLMDRDGSWSLSPAYDITFAYSPGNRWLKAHQMTINGKLSNFTMEDLVTCGLKMDLRASKCKKIIEEVRSVVMNFQKFARSVGIREKTIEMIDGVIQSRKF